MEIENTVIKQVITLMDWATIAFAFFGMFFAGKNWWNTQKQMQPIKIIIERDGERKSLPLEIIRKNFTRSEVFGVLGAFDKDSSFKIAYTAKKEFFKQISDIQESKKDSLIVKIQEGDKFDWIL